jgi:hypothetical protein
MSLLEIIINFVVSSIIIGSLFVLTGLVGACLLILVYGTIKFLSEFFLYTGLVGLIFLTFIYVATLIV